MSVKDAIVKTIGKDKYNDMLNAGISDISILEHACLTAFMEAEITESKIILQNILAIVWNKAPESVPLNLDSAL